MTLPAIPEPTSLVQVQNLTTSIETWAASCESVAELKDAGNKLAAIDEYLARTSTDGRAQLAATMRRLEVRIGQLLGPAEPTAGPGRGKPSTATDGLSRDQRSEFRRIAEQADVVEAVIAESTDEAPASRRQVLAAITKTKPRRTPLPDRARSAGWELHKSVERIERIVADDRFRANRDSIALQLRAHVQRSIANLTGVLERLDEDSTR